jgi:tetratricopeptide (TPR) repeat protein
MNQEPPRKVPTKYMVRAAATLAVAALLAAGVANRLFGWPVWESWTEHVVGVLVLITVGMALWMKQTPQGRVFEGSVLLGVYRAEGMEGIERLFGKTTRQGRGSDYYFLGNLLAGLGDDDGADVAYRRAAGFNHGSAMSVLGREHFERGDYEEAERWLRQAQALGVEGVDELLAEAALRRELSTGLDA